MWEAVRGCVKLALLGAQASFYASDMNAIRSMLRLGLALCLLAFPCRAFDAAGDELSSVNNLPRVALVIGNSRYKDTPLKNPGNDANAIAAQLQRMGFTVTLKVDAGRQEMIEAMRAFGGSLAKSKGIGLFYFAGHGAQLAWRNYLIPVDAAVNTIDDMQSRAVDMNALLDDLIRARNPMNIIILDACRDNPFGSQVVLTQKGLSQVDAPAGTLLAYATAPGNVAADGTGSNGLYTEFLLKEIQARDAKIEDIFKRVRLNVRRLSKGQQIPWESTSLEQDFYFIPPAAAKKLAPEELERQFEEELDIWTQIRASKDPAPLEDYLRRFPSGKFSELAQFRLDRLLAQMGEKPVEVGPSTGPARPGPSTQMKPASNASAPAVPPPLRLIAAAHAAELASVAPPGANPFTKGTAKADADYRVGDTYTYSRMDVFSKVEMGQFTERVSDVTDDEVVYNRGRRTTDLLGNDVVDRAGNELTPSQVYVYEYAVGKKWSTRFHIVRSGKGVHWKKGWNREDDIELSFKVVAKETITVPAGTFEAYRVEGHGHTLLGGTNLNYVYWIAPGQVRRVLALEIVGRNRGSRPTRADRYELVSFRQAAKERARVARADYSAGK